MSACSFTITYHGSASDLIQKAKQAIMKADKACFEGDHTIGSFSLPTPLGQVKGTYAITGQEAVFTIQEKPFLVSCKLIEEKIKGYIAEDAEKSKDH